MRRIHRRLQRRLLGKWILVRTLIWIITPPLLLCESLICILQKPMNGQQNRRKIKCRCLVQGCFHSMPHCSTALRDMLMEVKAIIAALHLIHMRPTTQYAIRTELVHLFTTQNSIPHSWRLPTYRITQLSTVPRGSKILPLRQNCLQLRIPVTETYRRRLRQSTGKCRVRLTGHLPKLLVIRVFSKTVAESLPWHTLTGLSALPPTMDLQRRRACLSMVHSTLSMDLLAFQAYQKCLGVAFRARLHLIPQAECLLCRPSIFKLRRICRATALCL